MRIKRFYIFTNESQTEGKGFDWFNQDYLKNNGWKQKDKVASQFEHKSPSNGFFYMTFKEDPKLGQGFELTETIGNKTDVIKTMYEKEDCWSWFKNWMKTTLNKPKDDKPKPEKELSTFHKITRFLSK